MKGRRRDTQSLSAASDRRIVDGLNVYAVFAQHPIADLLAQHGIANHHRHNVTVVPQMRYTCVVQALPEPCHPPLQLHTLNVACL